MFSVPGHEKPVRSGKVQSLLWLNDKLTLLIQSVLYGPGAYRGEAVSERG